MRSSSLIVLVVLVAIAGLIAWSFHSAAPVAVLSSHLERGQGMVYVEGKLRNASSSPAAIDVEVHYYDGNGRAIGQNEVSLAKIPAGGVSDFKTPPLSLDGVTDFSIYLNHGRNPYGN
jgi:hypothetical protein